MAESSYLLLFFTFNYNDCFQNCQHCILLTRKGSSSTSSTAIIIFIRKKTRMRGDGSAEWMIEDDRGEVEIFLLENHIMLYICLV